MAVLFLSIGISLILIEVFLRVNTTFSMKYSFYKYDISKKKPMAEWLTKDAVKHRPSSILGYELVPNSTPEINSYGMIGKEHKLEKENNTYRILLLGDSIAAQGYSTEFLEEKLNDNPILNKKYKFEIWNAGVPGYDVRQYANYLRYKGIKYSPNIVIIFFCLNDFDIDTCVYYKDERGFTSFDLQIKELSKKYILNLFLLKHSYLYRFIIMRLENYLINKKINQHADPREEEGVFYLSMIKDICQKNNIPLFCVIFCYLKPIKEYNSYERLQHELMLKVLKNLKVNYIDLEDYLVNKELISFRINSIFKNKIDYIHPSENGHKIIADIIYNHLWKDFLDGNILLPVN